MDILNYIDKMQEMYEGKPSSMVPEPRSNYADGLKVDPIADSGRKLNEVIAAYERYRGGRKNPVINFNKFFEIYARENFANGQLVQPSGDGSRPGYAGKDKFTVGSGPGTGSALEAEETLKKVKVALNKIKKQKNNKNLFEWSEKSNWYNKLRETLGGNSKLPNGKFGMNRDFTNQLINQAVEEFFPGAYHGKDAIKNFRNDMVVKSFIQHLKSVGEFDGQEKFDKVLEQFKNPPKKGTPNNYESINKSWKAWRAGEFEVDGVDRAKLKKELKARGINYDETIGKWTASGAQLRGKDKIKELKTLNKLNRFTNKSAEEIRALFLKEHPNANFYLRVNELTQLKRNGVYVSGANTELPVTGIDKGDRANWLKKAYGKQFAGNYSKIINAADKLNDPNYMGGKFYDPEKAKRLYNAADKFFGPTGIIRKSAVGEAEHALARSFDFLNPDRQLAINSIVSGDLNQFKKNLFDIPVKRYFDEYNKEGTTNARKKELKNLIEERKKIMNAMTGGQKKGIVAGDIVNFRYGDKITATSNVKAIDVLFDQGKFNIDDYIAKGTAYGEAFKKAGAKANIFTETGNIKSTYLKPVNQANILRKMGFKCKFAGSTGGAARCDDPASYTDDINKTRQNLNSSDVAVRAQAISKQRNALKIAKTLPTIGKFLRRVGQATVGGVSKALQATGLGTPVGLAIEGMVEGGIYDYYRGQGYTHNQAYSETFFPGMVTGRKEGVPWYGGAKKLLEKELLGSGFQQNPKVLQYQKALEDQEQVYDAFSRKALGLKAQRKDIRDAASADIQDLYRSRTINNINRIMDPESMASQAYNTAIERQVGLQNQSRRWYSRTIRW
jgi:hypothetical protein